MLWVFPHQHSEPRLRGRNQSCNNCQFRTSRKLGGTTPLNPHTMNLNSPTPAPPITCYIGFWVSQHEEIGCDTPPPPACKMEVGYLPCKRGYLSKTCVTTHIKIRKSGCETPPCAILSRKGIARYARYGGDFTLGR